MWQQSFDDFAGDPGGGHAPSVTAMHNDSRTRDTAHEAPQFLRSVTTQNRDHAVMSAHRMEAEQERHTPQTGNGEPTAAELAHHHTHPRHAIALAQQYIGCVSVEMMQQL